MASKPRSRPLAGLMCRRLPSWVASCSNLLSGGSRRWEEVGEEGLAANALWAALANAASKGVRSWRPPSPVRPALLASRDLYHHSSAWGGEQGA